MKASLRPGSASCTFPEGSRINVPVQPVLGICQAQLSILSGSLTASCVELSLPVEEKVLEPVQLTFQLKQASASSADFSSQSKQCSGSECALKDEGLGLQFVEEKWRSLA